MQLRDKKVLLTGASGGIGKAIAEALLQQGASLVLAGRDIAALNQLKTVLAKEGVHIDVGPLDLGSPQLTEQARALLARHPDIDVLINGAGVNQFSACDTQSTEQLASLIDINLKGTLLLTTALLPALKQRPEAAVVIIGSTFGSIGYPGFAAYCASKFGVRGYSEALRRELADTRVRVFYVAPRATRTAMNEQAVTDMNQELGVAMDEPQWVADQLVQAIANNRFKLFLGWPEKWFVIINGVFSSLVDKALIKQLPTVQRYMKRNCKNGI
ncbi:SDR family oxidoreductase [Ketobacter sp.]|uniref:SDR family oxidoreductase n=1 Tax=Ketobacter sp. TaxID=2083498 RepID=UPI000F2A198E|nr:SDR family oxidoreductase [Ketobacter sp.]RLU00206.1 MAG: SDR family oxidoreductase [Ketobacter sp.]